MSDLITTRKPETIANEIVRLSNRMLEDAIEVGRRFVELKAAVPHGEWGEWLKYTGYKSSSANNMMRLFEAYGADELSMFGNVKSQTFGNLGYSKALALLAVPEERREEFAVEVDAENLSVRELKAKIKELNEELEEACRDNNELCEEVGELDLQAEKYKETIRSLEQHKADADLAIEAAEKREQELRLANQRIEELENRPVEVAVQDATPEQLAEAEERGRKAAQDEVNALRQQLEEAKTAKDDPNQRALAEINVILRGWQNDGQRLGVLLGSLDDVTRKRVSGAVGQVMDAVRKGVEGR